MQSRVPRTIRVEIGAPVDQELGQPPVAAHSRDDQRTIAIRRGLVQVRPSVEQQPSGFAIAATGRKQKRREAASVEELGARWARCALHSAALQMSECRRADVDGGTVLEQHASYLGMSSGRGPHQGSLSSRRLTEADIRTISSQSPNS